MNTGCSNRSNAHFQTHSMLAKWPPNSFHLKPWVCPAYVYLASHFQYLFFSSTHFMGFQIASTFRFIHPFSPLIGTTWVFFLYIFRGYYLRLCVLCNQLWYKSSKAGTGPCFFVSSQYRLVQCSAHSGHLVTDD